MQCCPDCRCAFERPQMSRMIEVGLRFVPDPPPQNMDPETEAPAALNEGSPLVNVKPVAYARFRLQILRSGRVGLQLAPELRDVHSQVLRLVEMIRTPHFIQ
jgi:hypothetical protein